MAECIFDKLTDRQRACLRLVRDGFTTKEIAGRINASPDAVDKSIKLAMAKLGVDRRAAAARMLEQHEEIGRVQPLDPQSSDLPEMVGYGNIEAPPRSETVSPTVQEDRVAFEPILGSRHVSSPSSEGVEDRTLRHTLDKIFDRVVRIAGITLMILALSALVSIVIHRWEEAHDIRPR